MFDLLRSDSMVRSAFIILTGYARLARKPFPEVAAKYAVLLSEPAPSDVEGRIRYLEGIHRLFGEMAEFFRGPPVFESKGNQRKLLILDYISRKGSVTSFDVSRDLEMSLTNASERLRRYYKQDLLSRRALMGGGRGRPTMVYTITWTGKKRLAFLKKTVRFRRPETERSELYSVYQSYIGMFLRRLRLSTS